MHGQKIMPDAGKCYPEFLFSFEEAISGSTGKEPLPVKMIEGAPVFHGRNGFCSGRVSMGGGMTRFKDRPAGEPDVPSIMLR